MLIGVFFYRIGGALHVTETFSAENFDASFDNLQRSSSPPPNSIVTISTRYFSATIAFLWNGYHILKECQLPVGDNRKKNECTDY